MLLFGVIIATIEVFQFSLCKVLNQFLDFFLGEKGGEEVVHQNLMESVQNIPLLQKNNVTTAKIIIFRNERLKFSKHEKIS